MRKMDRMSGSPQVKLATGSGVWMTPSEVASGAKTWSPPGPQQ